MLDIPADEYAQVERLIEQADSPVGIDAKKTHVLILHKLLSIEARLARLEKGLGLDPLEEGGPLEVVGPMELVDPLE